MKITAKDVLHTATLAHLHLSPEEITQTAEDLDTKDIVPFEHPRETENSLRQDRASESLSREKTAKNTPSVHGPFIKDSQDN